MNELESVRPQLDRLQQRSLIIGVAGLVLCAGGALVRPDQFFPPYLVAYLFWLGIALGSFAILMLHHMVGGGWGFVIRRFLESSTRTIPLMAVLFVPILFGLHRLYEWTHPEIVAHDQALQHKSAYLNVPFFLIRLVIYFAVWLVVAYYLNKWSVEQDRTADAKLTRRLQVLSGPGLILYGATVTFASIDWAMSLEPHWFSTIYGMLFMVGQGLNTLAFMVVVLALVADQRPLSAVVSRSHFQDLGNLLLAFVMLWAYISFSQFLIIWSGNLPEEIPWYLRRLAGAWKWIGAALILFHFMLPFLLLLSRGLKRNVRLIAIVAIAIMLMRLVDLYWIVQPAFRHAGLFNLLMSLAALIGIGGLWIAVFIWQLKDRPVLPLHDPRFEESLHHV
jgi:hypothetical protein